jgi:hypothetical protein
LTKLVHAVLPISVAIGGEPVVPEFAGLAPGFAGLWQINVRLPVDISSGVAIPLQVSVTLPDRTNRKQQCRDDCNRVVDGIGRQINIRNEKHS